MKRIMWAYGTAAAFLLSSSAMAHEAAGKKDGEACSCGHHDDKAQSKKTAKKGKKTAATCEHCGKTECTCSKEDCAKCEHCQHEKAEGKKGACECGHHAEKAAPAAKPKAK